MIRVALGNGGDAVLYVLGITDLDVERLTRRLPILVDLREMGGHDSVVFVHGSTAEDLRQELAKVIPAAELAKLTASLDQPGARERDVAATGGEHA